MILRKSDGNAERELREGAWVNLSVSRRQFQGQGGNELT